MNIMRDLSWYPKEANNDLLVSSKERQLLIDLLYKAVCADLISVEKTLLDLVELDLQQEKDQDEFILINEWNELKALHSKSDNRIHLPKPRFDRLKPVKACVDQQIYISSRTLIPTWLFEYIPFFISKDIEQYNHNGQMEVSIKYAFIACQYCLKSLKKKLTTDYRRQPHIFQLPMVDIAYRVVWLSDWIVSSTVRSLTKPTEELSKPLDFLELRSVQRKWSLWAKRFVAIGQVQEFKNSLLKTESKLNIKEIKSE
jgi:hypothetical protein